MKQAHVAPPPGARATPAVAKAPATAAAAAPAAPAAPVAPATVHLRVVGQAHARVRLDGRDVGALPLDLELPSQPQPRLVMVSAPGFAPFSERVAGDGNGTLAVRLLPLVKREARAHHKSRTAPGFDPESPLPP